MTSKLYFNYSDRNVMAKDIHQVGEDVQILFKRDTTLEKPTFILDEAIAIDNTVVNYLYVAGNVKRCYYVNDVLFTQGHIELVCEVDPLMSFKNEILEQPAIIKRQATKINYYLNDDKLKANQYTHRDTYRFSGGFDAHAQEFILTVVGNSEKSYQPSSGDDDPGNNSGGGSSNPYNNVSQETYDETPEKQKETNGKIYTVPDQAPEEEKVNQKPNYVEIGPRGYANLSEEEKNNGNFYYVSDDGSGATGYRNIEITKENYNDLADYAKNNNIPYFVKGW